MKICPRCSAAYDDKPNYCSLCGSKLPTPATQAYLVTEEGVQGGGGDSPAPAPAESLPTAGTEPLRIALPPVQNRGRLHAEEAAKQSKKSAWKFLSLLAVAFVILLAFVWGVSILHDIIEKRIDWVEDQVTVMESDNDELVGVSVSGKQVKLKTDARLAVPESGTSSIMRSADGSQGVFLDSENVLRLFDGSRFTTVGENVQHYAISYDGSAVAYINSDSELFLYSGGKSQAVAARVTGNLCLSPKGDALAYVKEDGEGQIACYFHKGNEREIARGAVPLALSNGAAYVYYLSAKSVVYVQRGSDNDSRQKLADAQGNVHWCLNINAEQILIHDGSNTYFSENGSERVKIASVPLTLLIPEKVAQSGGCYGIKNLKDKYYSSAQGEGYTVYHLNSRLELSSLVKNIRDYNLLADGSTLLYCKNGNLYSINLEKAEKGESKIAGNIKGYRVSGSGKQVLFVDEEGETWFVKLGRDPSRITAETISTAEVCCLDSVFVYELEGSLYYTDGGKGSKISGLSDEIQSLSDNGFMVFAECKNGEVFVSTNGEKFAKYIRK